MKISDIARDIGRKLNAAFPGSVMYVDDIPAGAEGNFLLVITEISGGDGITPRRKRSVSFDVVYFSKPRDALAFADWAELMENTLRMLSGEGQIFHTAERNAVRTDMQYHYMFTVSSDFLEYTPGDPMETLEESYGQN
ncbi:putative uncharacterized protein [Eubacterium sp. CAG:786]|nr:putative uncharacterized protein [Eubacterium sp. CAG:786]